MRPQRGVRLLTVPRAAIGRAEPVGDTADRRDGRKIDVGIDRREHDEARVGGGQRLERQGTLARVADPRQRMR